MANTQLDIKSIFTDGERMASKRAAAVASPVFKGDVAQRSDTTSFHKHLKENTTDTAQQLRDDKQQKTAERTPQAQDKESLKGEERPVTSPHNTGHEATDAGEIPATAAKGETTQPQISIADVGDDLEIELQDQGIVEAKLPVDGLDINMDMDVDLQEIPAAEPDMTGADIQVMRLSMVPSEEEMALASSTKGGDALILVQKTMEATPLPAQKVDTPERLQEVVLDALPEDMPEAGVKISYSEKEAPKTVASVKPMGSAQELQLMGVKDMGAESVEALVERLHGGDLVLPQGSEEEGQMPLGSFTNAQRAMPLPSAILHAALHGAKNAFKEENKLSSKMVRDFKVDVATARGNVQVNLKFEEGHTHIRVLTDSPDMRRQFEQDREALKQLVAQFEGQGETTLSFEMHHQDTPQEQEHDAYALEGTKQNQGSFEAHGEGYYLGNETLGEMRAWARDNHDGLYVDII